MTKRTADDSSAYNTLSMTWKLNNFIARMACLCEYLMFAAYMDPLYAYDTLGQVTLSTYEEK